MATATIDTPAVEPSTPPFRIHLIHPSDGDGFARGRDRIDLFVENHYSDEVPDNGIDKFECQLTVAPGVVLRAVAWGNHIFVDDDVTCWHVWTPTTFTQTTKVDDPFITAKIVKPAYTQKVQRTRRVQDSGGGYWNRWKTESYETLDGYEIPYWSARSTQRELIPYAYMHIEVQSEGAEPVTGVFRFKQPDYGTAVLVSGSPTGDVTITTNYFGMTRQWTEHLAPVTLAVTRDGGYVDHRSNNPLETLCHHLKRSECPDHAGAWWATFLKHQPAHFDERGLKALLKQKKYLPMWEALEKDHPVDWAFFRWLTDGQTKQKVKVNTLLVAMVKHLGPDAKAVAKALSDARALIVEKGWSAQGYGNRDYSDTKRAVAKELPGGKERVEEQEAKADWRKRKTAGGKADGLGITEDVAPRLRKAVEDGLIPATVFEQPKGSGYKAVSQPVNREFALWEKALARKGWAEVLGEIAQDAANRKTYERDITPYIAFLFRIEKYLNRHTEGRKQWTAIPKFVSSQWELEMDEPTDGTTKRRSAFTPVADNEARTVTVPYVAVVVHGRMSQWCYSQHYYVFEEGMTDPESMGIVVNELEEKLNGRDDYGLMYFTLTGTVTARGYPTFLIIFERLAAGTRVHFHRVHPCRSKNRVQTPACELIARCYQYMAGNVPAEDVEAQQGDLIFIKHPHDPVAAGAKVADPQDGKGLVFESHALTPLWDGEAMMRLYVSEAKTPRNRLGFLWSPGNFAVRHPEHDDIEQLAEGWWEIRRCRSWEANPKAIWSLTID